MKRLILKKGKDVFLQRRHPWIFSGAISNYQDLIEHELYEVVDHKENFIGIGFGQKGSIAIKMLTFQKEEINTDLFYRRLETAFNYRLKKVLDTNTTACRMVFGEADALPGLIIDLYGSCLVLEFHSAFYHKFLSTLVDAGQQLLNQVKSVYLIDKTDKRNVRRERLAGPEPEQVIILENGHTFKIDILSGQKTGFFLDQRENRKLLAEMTRGKRVLNAFSYSGGFSIYAAHVAKEVVSLDISSAACELARENLTLNDIDPSRHPVVEMDVFEYLKQADPFDFIILDPPAFAKHMKARHQAVQGYKRINMMGMEKLTPQGILATFSCSQVVSKDLFEDTVRAASFAAQKPARITGRLGHAADHPVVTTFPEGEYLKGLILEL